MTTRNEQLESIITRCLDEIQELEEKGRQANYGLIHELSRIKSQAIAELLRNQLNEVGNK